MSRPAPHAAVLAAALVALAALYALWFHDDRQAVAAMAVFALPPLLLLPAVLRGSARGRFWAGVLGLLWFSHGVMAAWAQPEARGLALALVVLSLAIVFASSWPGLSARFGGRGRRGGAE